MVHLNPIVRKARVNAARDCDVGNAGKGDMIMWCNCLLSDSTLNQSED